MKVENKKLIIDDEITDEEVEKFVVALSQDNIKKIEIDNPNLGASIIQALLLKKKDTEIIVKDKTLQKVFENVSYKTV